MFISVTSGFVSMLTGFATKGTAENKLRQELFSVYDKSVRPVEKPDQFINVSFAFRLSKIVQLVSQPINQSINRFTFYQSLQMHIL